MALIADHEQSNFKHFCKICKKGFMCGRALGGHMRAHGIGDEGGSFDDDDQASDWDDKSRGGGGGEASTPPSNKRNYALRTNPNRLKNCKSCENCGKEFSSWKSFLEHGKCSSEDAESPLSSRVSDGDEDGDRRACGWSKKKRSYRTNVGNFTPNNCPSSEEEDLANCLMMLSNAMVDPLVADQPEESCASASKEEERRNTMSFINPIRIPSLNLDLKAKGVASNNPNKGMFECKACKKVFNSHQALGGHRASHKKVKGCFAARLDLVDQDSLGDEDTYMVSDQEYMRSTKLTCTSLQLEPGRSNSPMTFPKRKSKVHECSICHRVFSSGQALGGHKRCHWITSNAPDPSTLARFQEIHDQIEQVQEMPTLIQSEKELDLNRPAPNEEMMGIRRDPRNPLSFEVPTDIFLQSWGGINTDTKHEHRHHHQKQPEEEENENDHEDNIINEGGDQKKISNDIVYQSNVANSTEDDEADSKVKLAKLCEIKDHMTTNGCSSPWLQVGIGSSTAVKANP